LDLWKNCSICCGFLAPKPNPLERILFCESSLISEPLWCSTQKIQTKLKFSQKYDFDSLSIYVDFNFILQILVCFKLATEGLTMFWYFMVYPTLSLLCEWNYRCCIYFLCTLTRYAIRWFLKIITCKDKWHVKSQQCFFCLFLFFKILKLYVFNLFFFFGFYCLICHKKKKKKTTHTYPSITVVIVRSFCFGIKCFQIKLTIFRSLFATLKMIWKTFFCEGLDWINRYSITALSIYFQLKIIFQENNFHYCL
jgi:hypothetical protein